MHHIILFFVSIILIICIYQYFSPIKEGLKKPKNPFAGILKQIKKPIDDIFKKIMKPIKTIIDTIKCTIKLVINIPKCMLYYLLDIWGFIFYLPFSLLFWVIGAKKIEIQMWKGIYKIDTLIYEQSGYHIFHWSNDILNKCYRCVAKKQKKIVKKTIGPTLTEPELGTSAVDIKPDAGSISKAVGIVFMLCFIWFLILFVVFKPLRIFFNRIYSLFFNLIVFFIKKTPESLNMSPILPANPLPPNMLQNQLNHLKPPQ